MSNWKEEIEDALTDFVTVARLARHKIGREELTVNYMEAPHRPPSHLPLGNMAVYGFCVDGHWLKIGLAGPKSNARYTSQHYNPNSALSTLAASILRDPSISINSDFNSGAPGDWIKSACGRVNILLDSRHGLLLLALLEAFLHVRLKPRYER